MLFDEEHHGIRSSGNIGCTECSRGLACAPLEKSGTPLVPKHLGEGAAAAEVRDKDAETGFINLLDRSIPPARLAEVCLRKWEKSTGRQATDAERTDVRAVLCSSPANGGKGAVAAYRSIAEGLRRPRRPDG